MKNRKNSSSPRQNPLSKKEQILKETKLFGDYKTNADGEIEGEVIQSNEQLENQNKEGLPNDDTYDELKK